MQMRALILAALALMPGLALADCTEDAMLVFDASGSMAEMGCKGLDVPRINAARRVLHEALPRIAPMRRVGLIVYGPGGGAACSHLDLRLPPTPDAADRILTETDALTPDGNPAPTRAVRRAVEAREDRSRPDTVVFRSPMARRPVAGQPASWRRNWRQRHRGWRRM